MRNLQVFSLTLIGLFAIHLIHAMHFTRCTTISSSWYLPKANKQLASETNPAVPKNSASLVRSLSFKYSSTRKERPLNVFYGTISSLSETSEKYPNNEDWTDLHEHAYKGSNEHLKKMVTDLFNENKSKIIDVKDRYGRTPLWWAASKGQCESVDLLLKAGAEINESDARSQTPLHAAADTAGPKMVALLLKNRAQADLQDCLGETPLHELSYANPQLWWKEDTHIRNAETILNFDGLRLLDIEDKKGYTPVERAAHENYLRILSVYSSYAEPTDRIMPKLSDSSLVNLILSNRRFQNVKLDNSEAIKNNPIIAINAIRNGFGIDQSAWSSEERRLDYIYSTFTNIKNSDERLSFLRKEMLELDKKTTRYLFYAFNSLLEVQRYE